MIQQKNGIIVLNKPSGLTSNECIKIVKQKLNAKKLGHTGTLDKFAQGVLIILVNYATKLQDYITNKNKKYYVEFDVGYETDSLDIYGEKIKFSNKVISEDELKKNINKFIGKQKQNPPIFSAKKIQGRKLYYHWKNQTNLKLNNLTYDIEIFDIKIDKIIKNKVTLIVKCSKGTYIRALVRDICYKFDTVGTTTKLIRLENFKYSLNDSINIDELNWNKLISLNNALDIKSYNLNNLNKFKNTLKCLPICVNNELEKENLIIIKYRNKEIAIYKKIFHNLFEFKCWLYDLNENIIS